MRNYFAHKGEHSAVKARGLGKRYGIAQTLSPPELLCTRAPGRFQPLIADWLDDLRSVIRLTL